MVENPLHKPWSSIKKSRCIGHLKSSGSVKEILAKIQYCLTNSKHFNIQNNENINNH